MNKKLIWGIVIVVVIIIGGFYAYVSTKPTIQLKYTDDQGRPVDGVKTDSNPTASDWKTYSDVNLSIQYPSNWVVKKIDDSYTRFSSPESKTTSNDFEVSVSTTTNVKNAKTLAEKYNKLIGNKGENSTLKINDVSASRIDFADEHASIHQSRVYFDSGLNTYQLTEVGPVYYKSPLFDSFIHSFKLSK
jgi:hypothetical protein